MVKKTSLLHRKSRKLPKLTPNNYYSKSTADYESKSRFWGFLNDFGGCESAALAQMEGKYDMFKDHTPLIYGNYLHSYFESLDAHKKFIHDHEKELFKRGNPKNGLMAKYQGAHRDIERLIDNPNFRAIYQGDTEVIVKGDIFGVPWKGKIDCLALDRNIFFDLKTVRKIHQKFWNDYLGAYTNFIYQRGYYMQMAVYQQLIYQTFGKWCMPYIIAVSKEKVPEIQIFGIDQTMMNDAMGIIKMYQPRIEKVIHKEIKPHGCGKCDWCKSKTNLVNICHPGFRPF